MDLTKPVPQEAVFIAILFFVTIITIGIFFVNRYRRKS